MNGYLSGIFSSKLFQFGRRFDWTESRDVLPMKLAVVMKRVVRIGKRRTNEMARTQRRRQTSGDWNTAPLDVICRPSPAIVVVRWRRIEERLRAATKSRRIRL
jgi:hypothetical protein